MRRWARGQWEAQWWDFFLDLKYLLIGIRLSTLKSDAASARLFILGPGSKLASPISLNPSTYNFSQKLGVHIITFNPWEIISLQLGSDYCCLLKTATQPWLPRAARCATVIGPHRISSHPIGGGPGQYLKSKHVMKTHIEWLRTSGPRPLCRCRLVRSLEDFIFAWKNPSFNITYILYLRVIRFIITTEYITII